jgi:hypothetical protein
VAIAARNEAGNICRCVRSLLAQDYPSSRLSIIVVDDHSTDETAAMPGLAKSAPGAWAALTAALLGSAAAFEPHVAATFHFRIPFCYGLLPPLGYTIGALLAFDSVRRFEGRVSWKDRIYS